MGVPVVALRGDRFVSRVGASLLTYSGLRDLVAESPQQYIDLAIELARDPQHLADLRRQLRTHLPNTPVFDAKAFTRGLEQCYVEMVGRAKALCGLKPAPACDKNLAPPKNSQESSKLLAEVPI
jgi:predicted O-linked N-acetylglucosamine transferase (SPINDLY family)